MTGFLFRHFAHRGLFGEGIPENSIAAFENAVANNYAIELDVHITRDNQVVVFHDYDLDRMTGVSGYIKDWTYEELSSLRLLQTGQTIPRLKDVLQTVDGKVPLMIELKTAHNGRNIGELEEHVFELLKDYKGEYAIESFNPLSVHWYKKHHPQVVRGLLARDYSNEKFNIIKKIILKNVLLFPLVRPNFICYQWDLVQLPVLKFIRRVLKVPLLVYTIKNCQSWEKVRNHCDSIIFEQFMPVEGVDDFEQVNN